MNAVKRPRPLAPNGQNPVCAMCGGVTELIDRFHCFTCHVSWDIENYWYVSGLWDDEGPQCPAMVRPYAGSLAHPRLAEIVERCLLTKGHDPGRHRNGRRDWTDENADGYLSDPIRPCAADRPGLVQDLLATAHASAEALGIPPS